MGTGIVHTTTGTGTKLTNTVWGEEHTYDASLNTTQTTAYKFVWKDASQQALALLNQAADVAWTDLDLTAYTSANAKMVYLQLRIDADTATKDYNLGVRKNGTAPTYYPIFRLNADNVFASDYHYMHVIVAVDADEVIEYIISMTAGGQADFYINVLGYWE